ncbi:protein ALP1-like [Salarias fasciatus]|uniref:Protein ALP1-like n=1 Tax=Salarias fasciatus TaxID=181472 RepID=A0A672JCR2_SALFA|nr:protein ALP1-like [Salarias fasciatus]XP_029938690.1 protein ALP1-like [Salarias fasciatus]XP_029938705.1 protein ALP1-like [Salarias fasciatus]
MDASKKAALVAVLTRYKQLQARHLLHVQKLHEEDRKRRRAAILALLQSRRMSSLRTGTEWEAMLSMDDHTFTRHFRIAKYQYEYLLAKLQEGGLKSEHSQGVPPIPAPKKLLMFLWFMANRSGLRVLSDKFDVSQSSVHRVTHQVLTVMLGLGSDFIAWPNGSQKRASAVAFRRICGLDRVIGVIDGCHIKLQRPSERGGDFMNHRSYYSVLLQGIVNEQGRFIDVFAGLPGMVQDARMLTESHFYPESQEKMGEYFLLGDSAYAERAFPFIITPTQDDGTLSEADLRRNTKISQGMSIVEQAFGRMKCRWKRLRDLQTTRLDRVVMIILAACCLHNLSLGTFDVCQHYPHDCPRQDDDNV